MAEIGSQPQSDASYPKPNNPGHLAEFQSKHPKFFLWTIWFLASAIGWILGMIAGLSILLIVCAWPVIGFVLWIALRRDLPHAGAWTLAIAGIFFLIAQFSGNFNGAAAWATLGLIVGIMQWLVIRRRTARIIWWAPATGAGWLLGWIVTRTVTHNSNLAIFAAAGGTVAGVMQWLILRKQFSRAKWWLVINTASWIGAVILLLALTGNIALTNLNLALVSIWPGLLAAAFTGIIVAELPPPQTSRAERSATDLRQSLTKAFSDEEFSTFCFDHFPVVYDDFSDSMSKSKKIQILLEHCERHDEWPKLLSDLHRERPQQFDRYL